MVDPRDGSLGEFAAVLERRPHDAVSFTVTFWGVRKHGLWSATTAREASSLWMTEYVPEGTSSFTGVEVAERKGRVGEWLRSISKVTDEEARSLISQGSFERTERLVLGYFRNAAAIGIAVLLARSLWWIPHAPGYLAATRRARLLSRGQCPRCRYSIVGLNEPVCPECGGPLDRTAEDPLGASGLDS